MGGISDEAPEAGAQGVVTLSMHGCGYRTRSLMDAVERDRGGSVRLLLDIESLGSLLVIIIGNRSKLRRTIEPIDFW